MRKVGLRRNTTSRAKSPPTAGRIPSTRRAKVGRIAGSAVVAVAALVGVAWAMQPDSEALQSGEVAPTVPTSILPGDDLLFSAAEVASPITAATTTTVATIPPSSVAPTTAAPDTTLAPTTVPTTVAVSVADTLPEQPPEPISPPPDPRGYEDQIQIGRISIPSLDVDEPLLEGIRLTTLDNGPGHWPGTALPGEIGNVVVAAHRTSHGGPFRHIDQLVVGDTVEFTIGDQVTVYSVTGTEIVNPDAIWIVDPTDTPTATLFACHPPGSVAQRIVVKLELSQ